MGVNRFLSPVIPPLKSSILGYLLVDSFLQQAWMCRTWYRHGRELIVSFLSPPEFPIQTSVTALTAFYCIYLLYFHVSPLKRQWLSWGKEYLFFSWAFNRGVWHTGNIQHSWLNWMNKEGWKDKDESNRKIHFMPVSEGKTVDLSSSE